MRYQSPVTSPLAHYWEEEISGFWNSWVRVRANGKRFIYMIAGDMILANIYMLINAISANAVFASFGIALRRFVARKNLLNGVKVAIDLSGSAFGLLISLPLWIVAAVLIKLDSKGPIFYTQLRVGQNRRRADRRRIDLDIIDRRQHSDRRQAMGFGKPFRIIKFRTMFADAEKYTGPVWASKRDTRVTRVGRFLRKARIDEIPQLINVLKGDMSLVGPRPERPYFVQMLDGRIDDYLRRFDVKPGVTGLAQVEHKYDESIEDVDDKVKYDLTYIRNLSVLQDIRILIKTVIVVLTARGW